MSKLASMAVIAGCIVGALTAEAIPLPAALGPIAITTVPYTIVKPGVYYLASNIAVPDASVADSSMDVNPVITIQASNVVLDLRGHTLSGSTSIWRPRGNGLPHALNPVGIAIFGNNVTVMNGNIKGFYDGLMTLNYSNEISPGTDATIITGIQVNYVNFSGGGDLGLYYQQTNNSFVRNCRFDTAGLADDNSTSGNTYVDIVMIHSDIYVYNGYLNNTQSSIFTSRPYFGK